MLTILSWIWSRSLQDFVIKIISGLVVPTTLKTSIFGTSDITFDKIIDGTKTLDELVLVNLGDEEFDSTLLRLGKGVR